MPERGAFRVKFTMGNKVGNTHLTHRLRASKNELSSPKFESLRAGHFSIRGVSPSPFDMLVTVQMLCRGDGDRRSEDLSGKSAVGPERLNEAFALKVYGTSARSIHHRRTLITCNE